MTEALLSYKAAFHSSVKCTEFNRIAKAAHKVNRGEDCEDGKECEVETGLVNGLEQDELPSANKFARIYSLVLSTSFWEKLEEFGQLNKLLYQFLTALGGNSSTVSDACIEFLTLDADIRAWTTTSYPLCCVARLA